MTTTARTPPDDQGWRLEIKKYPLLTQVGAWRTEDGQRYGGYYTQTDVKEIVAYAASRFVTVVPEISRVLSERSAAGDDHDGRLRCADCSGRTVSSDSRRGIHRYQPRIAARTSSTGENP